MAGQPTSVALLPTPSPHNLEAEQSVLGAMLIESDAITRAEEVLSPDDFYRDAHRAIYAELLAMRERGEAVDLITVADALKARGILDDVGGVAYLTTLTSFVPTAANIDDYARIVKDKAVRRQLVNESHRTITRAIDGDDAADRQVSDAASRLLALATATAPAHSQRYISAVFRNRLEQYEAATEHKGLTGWPTGLTKLDQFTGGLQNGEMDVLAARPNIGKTALALQMMRAGMRVTGNAVFFASAEMPAELLADRLIGFATGIEPYCLRSGQINDRQWLQISKAIGELGSMPLIIDDGSLTTDRIWASCRRIQLERPLGLIVIDYLQLLTDPGEGGNENLRVSRISHRIKAMAKDLQVPVLCLSQLSRAVDKDGRKPRPPRLSDLRDSGAIEQDADLVIFEHVDEDDFASNPRRTQIMVSKNRNGPVGDFVTMFDRSRQQFCELEERHEDPAPARAPMRRTGEYDDRD